MVHFVSRSFFTVFCFLLHNYYSPGVQCGKTIFTLQTWRFFFCKKFGKFNNFTLFNFGIKGWWISLSRPFVVMLYWVSRNLTEVVPVADKVDKNLQEYHQALHCKDPPEHSVDH